VTSDQERAIETLLVRTGAPVLGVSVPDEHGHLFVTWDAGRYFVHIDTVGVYSRWSAGDDSVLAKWYIEQNREKTDGVFRQAQGIED
jgi:hypothetical protein